MKSYTDKEQSRKLAEILPLESADMDYFPVVNIDGEYDIGVNKWDNEHVIEEGWIPCWSLAALLEQFEDTAGLTKDYGLWFCYYNRKSYCTKHYDNPVDACYEMILKLHELKML